MIAEDRIAGLLIRVARGEQIVEEEPISVRVIVLVVAEAIPRLYPPMTATIASALRINEPGCCQHCLHIEHTVTKAPGRCEPVGILTLFRQLLQGKQQWATGLERLGCR